MDKTERKKLKAEAKGVLQRRSQELQAKLHAENPWPVTSPQWVERYKELNQLQQRAAERGRKLYPIPAWAARGRISSHIYVGHRDEASQYDGQAERFRACAELSRITPFELTDLWAILRRIEWDETLVDGFDRILERDDGRRLIYRFPAEMVADLARVTPAYIAELTSKWADKERFAWRREATQRVIKELVRLAVLATESARSLYLWICF